MYRGFTLDEFCDQCYGNVADRKLHSLVFFNFVLEKLRMLANTCLYLLTQGVCHWSIARSAPRK